MKSLLLAAVVSLLFFGICGCGGSEEYKTITYPSRFPRFSDPDLIIEVGLVSSGESSVVDLGQQGPVVGSAKLVIRGSQPSDDNIEEAGLPTIAVWIFRGSERNTVPALSEPLPPMEGPVPFDIHFRGPAYKGDYKLEVWQLVGDPDKDRVVASGTIKVQEAKASARNE